MKVGRNESCPCGSGKKYKRCCMEKDAAAAVAALNRAADDAAGVSDPDHLEEEPVEVVADPKERAKHGKATLANRFWVPALVLAALFLTVVVAGSGRKASSTADVVAPTPAAKKAAAAADTLRPPPGGFSWEPNPNAVDPVPQRFSTEASDGGVWSEEHQHWHYPE